MKKLIPCFLLLLVVTAKAQNFEGTIKWSMRTEITDPAMKAKMQEAQQKMSDPATQAKIKEMQAKMNDPQMKAMMDKNPQMKAQMENTMKMMQGGDMSAMMAQEFVIKVKNQNTLTKMQMGMMPVEVLYLKDKGQSYRLDRTNRTYSVIPSRSAHGETAEVQPKVTKTSETAKILNYNCTKYLVELNEHGKIMNQAIWTTTDIKDIDLKAMAKHRMGRGQAIMYEGMDGVPLRVEMSTPEGNMKMEVTEIKRETLDGVEFVIPPDFKETQGMFGKF